jgi:hypothetical protein
MPNSSMSRRRPAAHEPGQVDAGADRVSAGVAYPQRRTGLAGHRSNIVGVDERQLLLQVLILHLPVLRPGPSADHVLVAVQADPRDQPAGPTRRAHRDGTVARRQLLATDRIETLAAR